MLGNPHTTLFASNAAGPDTLGNKHNLTEIETTYSLEKLNLAQEQGLKVVIIEREQNLDLFIRSLLLKHRITGEFKCASSRRVFAQYGKIIEYPEEEWELVRKVQGYGRNRDLTQDWGAYILPDNVVPGEKVYIPDLIEDVVASRFWESVWYASDAEAIWNGSTLEIDHSAYDRFVRIG